MNWPKTSPNAKQNSRNGRLEPLRAMLVRRSCLLGSTRAVAVRLIAICAWPPNGSNGPPHAEMRKDAHIAHVFYSFVGYRKDFANFASLPRTEIGGRSFGWANTTARGQVD